MIWASEETDVPEILAGQRAALERGAPDRPPEERAVAAEQWLHLMLPLGLALERAGPDAAVKIRAHLRESAGRLGDIAGGLGTLASRLELRLADSILVCEEWEASSERRSALEFTSELFTKLGLDVEDWIDFPRLDEALRERGERDGCLDAEAVPPGMPSSHWWWWLPDAPPSEQSA